MDNQCVLLSEEYINARTPLNYICECGNPSTVRWDDFRKGKRCRKCGTKKSNSSKKYNYSYVREVFGKEGYLLLSRSYNNNKEKLNYICQNNHTSSISFDSFLRGNRCNTCATEMRKSKLKLNTEQVKSILSKYDCELIGDYMNYDTKFLYKCSCGNITNGYLSSISKGIKCGCGYKTGSEHASWNPDLTQEDRERQRNYPEYEKWVQSVYERDNYTCQCCLQIGKSLNAHHIINYSSCKELRTDISNGITFCKKCHITFHKEFGYSNNNKEQITKFISRCSQVTTTKIAR